MPQPLHSFVAGTKEGRARYDLDARGEIRTRTGLPPVDFESTASAVPPLGLGRKGLPDSRAGASVVPPLRSG